MIMILLNHINITNIDENARIIMRAFAFDAQCFSSFFCFDCELIDFSLLFFAV
jgi:hypothetical protein